MQSVARAYYRRGRPSGAVERVAPRGRSTPEKRPKPVAIAHRLGTARLFRRKDDKVSLARSVTQSCRDISICYIRVIRKYFLPVGPGCKQVQHVAYTHARTGNARSPAAYCRVDRNSIDQFRHVVNRPRSVRLASICYQRFESTTKTVSPHSHRCSNLLPSRRRPVCPNPSATAGQPRQHIQERQRGAVDAVH